MRADCDIPPGAFLPVIDPRRGEAAGACVDVCPYDVLRLLPARTANTEALRWHTRMKVRIRGNKLAYAVAPDACRACGLCVAACPERAIRVRRTAGDCR